MKEKVFEIYRELLDRLPKNFKQEEGVDFTQDLLPDFEQHEFDTFMIAIKSNDSSIASGRYQYNRNQLHVCTNKQYYKLLGLLILTVVFKNKSITLNLINPESYIKKIIVELDKKYNKHEFLRLFKKPVSYSYRVMEVHPIYRAPGFEGDGDFLVEALCNNIIKQGEWVMNVHDIYEKPDFDGNGDSLTESEWDNNISEHRERAKGNVLKIEGGTEEMIGLSDLLLNIGNKKNCLNEIRLFQIVDEVIFWLPSSSGWNEKTLIPNES